MEAASFAAARVGDLYIVQYTAAQRAWIRAKHAPADGRPAAIDAYKAVRAKANDTWERFIEALRQMDRLGIDSNPTYDAYRAKADAAAKAVAAETSEQFGYDQAPAWAFGKEGRPPC